MHSDVIDLAGIDHDFPGFTVSYAASSGELTLSDGMHNASLTFQDFKGAFSFASDSHGGTLIMDPPATTTQGEVSSIGGNSQFAFKDFVATAALASIDDWGHTDAEVRNKLPVMSANDAGSEPWLFLHAITTRSELPGNSILDGRSHHLDSLNPKDMLSANLVANEFILPQH